MIDHTDINVTSDGHVGIVEINRPPHNFFDVSLIRQIANAFDTFDNDSNCRAIVLASAGKSFCAGANFGSGQTDDSSASEEFTEDGFMNTTGTLYREGVRLFSAKKPIIAAVNGYALGGGCEIATACHIRYASKNALFGQPEVKLGIIAGWGGTQNLPKLVGFSNAIDLLVSGKIINAEEAYRIGLVNKIFDQDNLIDEIMNLTRLINQNSPNAIANTLSSIYYGNSEKGYDNEAKIFKDSFKHNDSKVGIAAFINKHKPKF